MIQPNQDAEIFAQGVLEILPDGHGFLRSPDTNYLPARDDIYVAPFYISEFHLKTGDTIVCRVRPPRAGERYFTLVGVEAVNLVSLPEQQHSRREFYDLRKADPRERFVLETTRENLCGRVIDLMVPLGKGLNGLISSPPHTGEKLLVENIVNAIAINHPALEIIVLLLDQQPEEAAAMKRSFKADVFFSTSNEPEARHIQLAEIVMERAKRMVEQERDVFVLVDSISRLIEAYEAVLPPQEDAPTAGREHSAVRRAAGVLGASGKFQEGGSLTVIATAAAGPRAGAEATVNREFQETADVMIVLDRQVLNKGIFPAINIHRSKNKREELLVPKEDLFRIQVLRRVLSPLSATEALKLLGSKFIMTRSNAAFLSNMSSL